MFEQSVVISLQTKRSISPLMEQTRDLIKKYSVIESID